MEEVKIKEKNWIFKLILDHYGNTARIISPSTLEKEGFLIPSLKIKFSRWHSMFSGFFLQFCVGSVYAWSVFNKAIDSLLLSSNKAPVTFTLALTLLGLSAALMGPWLERKGPKKAALLGSLLFFLGNMGTALALHFRVMWGVWLAYGVVGGAGIGLCYIAPVSALQKWFPDKRGLASGVAVAGFGSGSIAMAKVQVTLMEIFGLPLTFVILGLVYFLVMLLAALVLRAPPPGVNDLEENLKSKETTLLKALQSPDFYLLYVAFFSNIMFGLVLISRLSNMITDIFSRGVGEAATIVAVNGGFNLLGRILFSIASDFVVRKNCYVFMLSAQLVILALFPYLTDAHAYSYYYFLGGMWLLTFCYGAGFSIIPAFLSDKFGTGNVGAVHGVILTAWSLASLVGGGVFTAVFNWAEGEGKRVEYLYDVNSYWVLGVVGVGLGAALMIKETERDKKFWRFLCCRKFV